MRRGLFQKKAGTGVPIGIAGGGNASAQPDNTTIRFNEAGALEAIGGSLLPNSEEWITESGDWEVPVTGWYEVLMFSGGSAGTVNTIGKQVWGGNAGSMRSVLVWLEEGQQVPITIGAGGPPQADPYTMSHGGVTSFGDVSVTDTAEDQYGLDFRRSYSPQGMPSGIAMHYAPGAGFGGGYAGEPQTNVSQAERNAICNAFGHFGGGGGASLNSNGLYAAGAGAPGSVRMRWHDPAKAAGPIEQES